MKLKNIKRKRLNNKGFTLIELLAVVVILAIVMGIAATSVLSSINNSRKSTLLSTAQNAANQLNTWAAEDALSTETSTMHIGTDSSFYTTVSASGKTDKWYCLNDSSMIVNNGGSPVGILTALGLKGAPDDSTGDIVTNGTAPTITSGSYSVTRANCSAVRYNTKVGAYEIFLTANNQGKYYVANDGNAKNYAFSRASSYATPIAD